MAQIFVVWSSWSGLTGRCPAAVSGKSEQAPKCCTLSVASQPAGTDITDPGG